MKQLPLLASIFLALLSPLFSQITVTKNFTGGDAAAYVVLGDDEANEYVTVLEEDLLGYQVFKTAKTGEIVRSHNDGTTSTASALASIDATSTTDPSTNTFTYSTTLTNTSTKDGTVIGGISSIENHSHQLHFTVTSDTDYTLEAELTSTQAIGGAAIISLKRTSGIPITLYFATNINSAPGISSGTLAPGTYQLSISGLNDSLGNTNTTSTRTASYTLDFPDTSTYFEGEPDPVSNNIPALPGVTYSYTIASEGLGPEGTYFDEDYLFYIDYSITNNSGLHVRKAELTIDYDIYDTATDLGGLKIIASTDSISRFRFDYAGIPNGITANGRSRIIVCAPEDADYIRAQLNANTFFAPDPYTVITRFTYNPYDLELSPPILESETVQPDNRIHLTYSFDEIVNTDSARFLGGTIGTNDPLLAIYDVDYPDGSATISLPYIEPNQTVALGGTATLSVLPAERDAIVALVEAGDLFLLEASEIDEDPLPIFQADDETLAAFIRDTLTEDSITLQFASETSMLSRMSIDDILVFSPAEIEDLEIFSLKKVHLGDDPAYLPFLVENMETIDGQLYLTGSAVVTTPSSGAQGAEHLVVNLPVSGAYRANDKMIINEYYDKPFETSYPPETEAAIQSYLSRSIEGENNERIYVREDAPSLAGYLNAGLNTEPYVLHDLEIIPGVVLNGQIFVRAVDLDFDIAWRNKEPVQFDLRYTTSLHLNLIIETRGGKDNRDDPDISKEYGVLDISGALVSIPVSAAHTLNIGAGLKLDTGIEVFLPGKATIPINTGITIGGTMRYHKGELTTDPIRDVTPPLISKAELREALKARVHAWFSGGVTVNASMTSVDAGLFPLLEGSATFGARVDTNFNLDPLGSPWWTLDGTLSTTVAADLKSFLIPITKTESEFGSPLTLFNIGAPGAMVSPVAADDGEDDDDITEDPGPELGNDVRWTTLLATDQPTTSLQPQVHALSGGDSIVLTQLFSGIHSSHLTRLDREGSVLWNLALQYRATAVTLPNDSILVTSADGADTVTLTKFDANGTLLWQVAHQYTSNTTISLGKHALATTTEDGQTVFYLAATELLSSTPILLKFDANGGQIFANHLHNLESSRINAIHIAADGDVLLTGDTTNKLDNTNGRNGSLSRIAPDGTPRWARFTHATYSDYYFDLAEDPATGDIYTVGQHSGTIVSEHTGIQIAKWTADGLLHKRIILEPEFDDATGYDAYAKASSCFFAHNSLFVAGSGGLGNDTTSWVTRLSPKLGPLFFTTIEGRYADSIPSLAASEEGFLCAFNSSAVNPWGGDGSTSPTNPGSGAHTLVSMQPWEGLLRFHELAQTETRFRKAVSFATYDLDNYPSVVPTNEFQLHDPGLDEYLEQGAFLQGEPMFPGNPVSEGPLAFGEEVGAFEYTSVTDLTVTPSDATMSAVPVTLPSIDSSDIPQDANTAYERWIDSFGLPTGETGLTDNPTDDGLSNFLKFAFNMDPTVNTPPDLTPDIGTSGLPQVSRSDAGGLRIEFIRHRNMPGLHYRALFSDNLRMWEESGTEVSVTIIDADWERVVVEDANPTRRFGQVEVSL